jgi:hypothetical protein
MTGSKPDAPDRRHHGGTQGSSRIGSTRAISRRSGRIADSPDIACRTLARASPIRKINRLRRFAHH